MSFPNIKWQEITGIVGHKFRGGPYHGKWMAHYEANGAILPVNVMKNNVGIIERYYLTKNYDLNRDEWIWGPLIEKKKKKWAKKREIELLTQELVHVTDRDPQIVDIAQAIMKATTEL